MWIVNIGLYTAVHFSSVVCLCKDKNEKILHREKMHETIRLVKM